MSVKLSRYVFRRIGGRIIPIRVDKLGSIANTIEQGMRGVSKNAMKKLNLLLRSSKFKITNAGNLRVHPERSGTDAMNLFMKKTGAVRVSISGDTLNLDPETSLTTLQKLEIGRMARGKEIFTHNSSSYSINKALSDAQKGKPIFKPTKLGDKIEGKALERYGSTDNEEMAGYVLRDGTKLNLSYGYGQRDIDHRDVADLVPWNLRKPKKGEIAQELARAQRSRKADEGRKHRHWSIYNDIKELQKSDFVTGKDRGEIIKDLISRLHPDHKPKVLQKLKKIRNKS